MTKGIDSPVQLCREKMDANDATFGVAARVRRIQRAGNHRGSEAAWTLLPVNNKLTGSTAPGYDLRQSAKSISRRRAASGTCSHFGEAVRRCLHHSTALSAAVPG